HLRPESAVTQSPPRAGFAGDHGPPFEAATAANVSLMSMHPCVGCRKVTVPLSLRFEVAGLAGADFSDSVTGFFSDPGADCCAGAEAFPAIFVEVSSCVGVLVS